METFENCGRFFGKVTDMNDFVEGNDNALVVMLSFKLHHTALS